MGSKSAIKVFKRKDLEQAIHHTSEPKMVEQTEDETKTERRSHRELADTITNWVVERRERSRVEEIEAIRTIFGETTPALSEA